MPRTLITGCSGYFGSELSAHFSDNGWSVFGIDTAPLPDGLSITDFQQTGLAIANLPEVDAVIHLAGLTDLGYSNIEYWDANVETTRILEYEYPYTPIIFGSTCAMYDAFGNPFVVHP